MLFIGGKHIRTFVLNAINWLTKWRTKNVIRTYNVCMFNNFHDYCDMIDSDVFTFCNFVQTFTFII